MSPRRGVGWLHPLLVFLACGLGASSASADPLELAEVLEAVDHTHPTLEMADQDVAKAKGKQFAAKGGFDPVLAIRGKWSPVGYYNNGQADASVKQATPVWGIAAYAGYRIGWGTYPSYKGDLETLDYGEVRAGIDVPVWRGGPIDKRRADIKRTEILSRAASAQRDAQSLELLREAADAYYTWVAAGKGLDIAEQLLSIAEDRADQLAKQVEAGVLEKIKLVDNERLVLDRQTKVLLADQKFQEAALKLSLYLRDSSLTPQVVGVDRVPPALPPLSPSDTASLDDEVRKAIRRRPELVSLQAERDAAEVDVKLAKNNRAPDVRVQAFVARDFGQGPVELAPTELGLGISVALPLLLRKARGDYQAARASLGSKRAKLRGQADKVAAEVRTAHVGLVTASKRVELARRQVDVAEALAEAERTRLRDGTADLVVVNIRELAAAEAATQVVDALADYHRAHASFMVATGRSPRT